MKRTSSTYLRAHRWVMRVSSMGERLLHGLAPARMRVAPYSWPLLPDICPCDLDFCEYLKERGIRGRAVFHFGSGGHHLVGLRNRDDGLENDILAITLSPREHAQYVRRVVREASLGAHYKVLFADIYNLGASVLPTFDVVSLFHLCEFLVPEGPHRRLDDPEVLSLFLGKTAPGGRILFYAGSAGREKTRLLVERALAEGRLSFDERYRSLLVYRTSPLAT